MTDLYQTLDLNPPDGGQVPIMTTWRSIYTAAGNT